jgi:hypothetical protein
MERERDFNRDWALRLAEAKIAVFPCGPDKRPLIKWREFSTSDEEAIAQMWDRFPSALPGIDLEKSDLVVLDGDRHGGPDGRAALRELLYEQADFDRHTAPAAITPSDGVHAYFNQNGHELTNARGNLPAGIDVRGAGGFVICPYAILPDGRRYKAVAGTPDLITAYRAGNIPNVPQGVVDLIQARKQINDKPREQPAGGKAGIREKSYAEAALKGCAEELAAAASGGRNELLNKIAFRLGRMIARRWLDRGEVETALIDAMHANGYVGEEGIKRVEQTLRSGLDAGLAEPHPDLAERNEEEQEQQPGAVAGAAPTEQHPSCTLAETHAVFRKWFGPEYDLDTINAVLAAAASERLRGDPLWLLVVSGPGNAKTETVQALSGAGAYVTSTIASEGALLSATPRRERNKNATGGLLRKIGDRGVLVIKDVTSILSADRNTRASVLAAIREIYDGLWQRNVGTDGGQTLTWTGRIVIVGAVTAAWDSAHAVIAAMGDRFVLIRADSSVGRAKSGIRAIHNSGDERTMRKELAAVVGGIVGHAGTNEYQFSEGEIEQLVKAADIVTMSRTAVECDYRGDVINAHAPEMPTRFAKQLAQMIRGAMTIGMRPADAMRLAIRCARDSIPPLRRRILLDLASNPRSRIVDVSRRVTEPYRTVRRGLEALHVLGMLQAEDEQPIGGDKWTTYYSLADSFDRATLLSMVALKEA